MDGFAATCRLKTVPEQAHIKVIALTAHAMKGDEEHFRAAGCDGYIPKPFHHRDLLAMVDKLLE
jgi:two-component system cell cycle response regulator DivK